ncbi:tumor necrosis factor receptor superfamily member wengen [Drosophila kikkawai]|uniref:Tumor necrosis factor receptor superfamily member wengen n=1 Tax=Drosophila kikkawai TaxID=30033 RepID=A0A6P4J5C5_DROKI|nr:tumor necrosis factor receptor superfamily member wengen [Drosophila kikkawai]KAH8345201.1 hypothetical protein KR059_008453 [Drosophila kikkawai]
MLPPRLPAELVLDQDEEEMHTMFHKRRRRRSSWLEGRPACLTLLLMLLLYTAAACTAASPATTEVSAPDDPPPPSSAISSSSSSSSPCAPQHWWDSQRDRCTACTRCQGEMIPLRPCQLHTDTICGSIYDLKIDWVVLAKTEPNWKERRKSSEYEHFDQNAAPLQHLSHEQLQQLHEEATAAAAWALDWQTGVLYVAVLTCLVFFSVAACILIHHMRQWRRMERRLDQDVEELSTKLMAKLAEVQSLDGGTFFIGNADALRGLPSSAMVTATSASVAASHAAAAAAAAASQSGIFQPQHVLLPEKRSGKHQERRVLKALQPGNVYIEESNVPPGGFGHGPGMGLRGHKN